MKSLLLQANDRRYGGKAVGRYSSTAPAALAALAALLRPPYLTARNSHGVHPITGLPSLVAGCQSMPTANWRARASKSPLSDGRSWRTSRVFPSRETRINRRLDEGSDVQLAGTVTKVGPTGLGRTS